VDTLAALTAAVEARHPQQRGHSARVTVYAEALARRLRWSPRMLDELRLGCALHDVGKLALPEHVLSKHGALSPEEEAALRRHPVEGARLIAGTEAFRRALPYVLYHHERWDGGGYPSGRAGEEIPLQARLLAVADAFDAMVSSRPHRPALPVEGALREVERCSGSQFDPTLAELFLATWNTTVIDPSALAAAVV
jgi:HD-GYP domain-containing protein (c-di-GMP phosphodiesterase class II)